MDRNYRVGNIPLHIVGSLSARRAWIEISKMIISVSGLEVALRKESVDRNVHTHIMYIAFGVSLSARRAWIEIGVMDFRPGEVFGRSPQGERG